MKTHILTTIAIIALSQTLFAKAELDPFKGTIKYCRESSDAGQVAIQADVQKTVDENRNLSLTIHTEVFRCRENLSGPPSWASYRGELIPSKAGFTSFHDFELMITSTDGVLFWVSPLNFVGVQTVPLSQEQLRIPRDGLIEIGTRARQTLVYKDGTSEDRTVFFGSYLQKIDSK